MKYERGENAMAQESVLGRVIYKKIKSIINKELM